METYYDEIDGDVLILIADGGLDAHETEAMAEKLERLVDAGLRKIIVDCSRIHTITSVALGMLVRLHRRLKPHGGDVKIAAVKGMVPQVLQITRLDNLFEMYPDVNRARLAFRDDES